MCSMTASVDAEQRADALRVAEQLFAPPACTTRPPSSTTTCCATRATTARFCSTRSTVASSAARSSATATSVTRSGASPFVGSSTSSTGFSFRSARAIATICCWPPESVPAFCPPRGLQLGEELVDQLVARLPFRSESRRFSSTVRPAKTSRSSGT